METTVKERLIKFINYKGLTINKFEKICGFSTGYIANMRVSIQPSKVQSIAKNFPDANTGWILTGEGEMLKTEQPEQPTDNIHQLLQEKERIISEQADHIKTLKKSIVMNERVIDMISKSLEIMNEEREKKDVG